MAKILRLKDLERRKRALIAESEVYRQTLTLEVQNLRLYAVRVQKKFAIMRLANPVFLLTASFLGSRLLGRPRKPRKPRGKWGRLFGAGLMGWRLYRQFGPLARQFVTQALDRRHRRGSFNPDERTPAANI